jgi:3-isopropylmalate dehydratase small subunit
MATVLPTETPQYAFADDAQLNGQLKAKQIPPGSVIVAGKNFGCGSSRETAPGGLKAFGIGCVIAPTFARIFLRNAINIGLPLLESAEAAREIADGDVVRVDFAAGLITDETTGATFHAAPFPAFLQEMIALGGLIPYTRRRLGLG